MAHWANTVAEAEASDKLGTLWRSSKRLWMLGCRCSEQDLQEASSACFSLCQLIILGELTARKQEELMQPWIVIAHASAAGLGTSCLCDWGTISRTGGLAGACSSHRDGIRAKEWIEHAWPLKVWVWNHSYCFRVCVVWNQKWSCRENQDLQSILNQMGKTQREPGHKELPSCCLRKCTCELYPEMWVLEWTKSVKATNIF